MPVGLRLPLGRIVTVGSCCLEGAACFCRKTGNSIPTKQLVFDAEYRIIPTANMVRRAFGPSNGDGYIGGGAMLELKNIAFTAPASDEGTVASGRSGKTIINDLSLNVEQGKITVITGPNGGGKRCV